LCENGAVLPTKRTDLLVRRKTPTKTFLRSRNFLPRSEKIKKKWRFFTSDDYHQVKSKNFFNDRCLVKFLKKYNWGGPSGWSGNMERGIETAEFERGKGLISRNFLIIQIDADKNGRHSI
jgi:hypothetical protein